MKACQPFGMLNGPHKTHAASVSYREGLPDNADA